LALKTVFQNKIGVARKSYRAFIENGVDQEKRSDLTGGGFLRSTGGWVGLKELRKAGIRVKCDERILGDSEFAEKLSICQSGASCLSMRGERFVSEQKVESADINIKKHLFEQLTMK
jgi:hypothetical protein